MIRRRYNPVTTARGGGGGGGGGFTLLELLIALVMAAVVAMSLVNAIRVAFGARQAAQRASGPTRASEAALDFIRQDIAGAVPPNPNWTDPTGIVVSAAAADSSSSSSSASGSSASSNSGTQLYLAGAFIGTDGTGDAPDDLTFYTTSDGPTHDSGDGEIKKVELTIDDGSTAGGFGGTGAGIGTGGNRSGANGTNGTGGGGGGGGVLVRRVLSNLTAPQQQQLTPDTEVLCRNVSTFNLRYFDGTTWQDSWDSTQTDPANELPVAVEVTIVLNPPADDPLAIPKKYVRIFPVICSTLVNDQNGSSTGGTTP